MDHKEMSGARLRDVHMSPRVGYCPTAAFFFAAAANARSIVGAGAPDKLLQLMLLLKVSTFGDA
jgi:hypothetical protein